MTSSQATIIHDIKEEEKVEEERDSGNPMKEDIDIHSFLVLQYGSESNDEEIAKTGTFPKDLQTNQSQEIEILDNEAENKARGLEDYASIFQPVIEDFYRHIISRKNSA